MAVMALVPLPYTYPVNVDAPVPPLPTERAVFKLSALSVAVPEDDRVVKAPVEGVEAPTDVPLIVPPVIVAAPELIVPVNVDDVSVKPVIEVVVFPR